MTTILFIGGLGPPELALIVLVLVLLFGASKLPKLARSMGSATGEFKKGRQEVEEELQSMQGSDGGDAEPVDDESVDAEPADAATETTSDPDTDAEPDRSNA